MFGVYSWYDTEYTPKVGFVKWGSGEGDDR